MSKFPLRKRFHTTKDMDLDCEVWDRKFYDIQLDFWKGLGARQIADKHGVYVGQLLRYLRTKTNTAAAFIPMDKHYNLIATIEKLDKQGCDLTLMAKEMKMTRTSLIGFLRIVGYKKNRKLKFINCEFTFNGVDGTTYSHCKNYEVDAADYRQYCERLRPYFKCALPHSIAFGMFLNNIDMPDEYCP